MTLCTLSPLVLNCNLCMYVCVYMHVHVGPPLSTWRRLGFCSRKSSPVSTGRSSV